MLEASNLTQQKDILFRTIANPGAVQVQDVLDSMHWIACINYRTHHHFLSFDVIIKTCLFALQESNWSFFKVYSLGSLSRELEVKGWRLNPKSHFVEGPASKA